MSEGLSSKESLKPDLVEDEPLGSNDVTAIATQITLKEALNGSDLLKIDELYKPEVFEIMPVLIEELANEANEIVDSLIDNYESSNPVAGYKKLIEIWDRMDTLVTLPVFAGYVGYSVAESVTAAYKAYDIHINHYKVERLAEWLEVMNKLALEEGMPEIGKKLISDEIIGLQEYAVDNPERLVEIDQRVTVLEEEIDEALNSKRAEYRANGNMFIAVDNLDDFVDLPEKDVLSAATKAKEQGIEGYVFSALDDWRTIQSYCSDRDLRRRSCEVRKQINDESGARERMLEIMKLRNKKANILGYESIADYKLKDRMFSNVPDLKTYLKKAKSEVEKDLMPKRAELERFAGIGKLESYDLMYYKRLMSEGEEEGSFSIYEKCEGLGLTDVLDKSFDWIKEYYGLSFSKLDVAGYQPGVQTFEILNAENDEKIGYWVFDPYKNDNKKAGEWTFSVRHKNSLSDVTKLPIVMTSMQITDDQSGGEFDPLLSLYEVKVIQHELGHVMHFLQADMLNHVNIAEYMEVPSMSFERTVYDPEFLKHFDLDDDVIENWIESADDLSSLGRLVALSDLDLAINAPETLPESPEELDAIVAACMNGHLPYADWFEGFYSEKQHLRVYYYIAGLYMYVLGGLLGKEIYAKLDGLDDMDRRVVGRNYSRSLFDVALAKTGSEAYKEFMGTDLV